MALNIRTLLDGPRKVIRRITATESSESDSVAVDLSALTGNVPGKTLSHLVIEEVWYSIAGYEFVVLEFDATTDSEGLRLSGDGYIDMRDYGGLVDPQASGSTGDILLTATTTASGDSLNILIVCRKKYA
ncbi:hypothetical protein KC963_00075 [Candidatus Saccharibacteria bacterium]|nr:hypothetical protein [Candidatus Saccharibacteria bacterium]